MQFKRNNTLLKKRIIFLSVFAAVLTALIICTVLSTRARKQAELEAEQQAATTVPPDILDEEGQFNNYPTAYPTIGEDSITSISISNNNGTYFMVNPTDGTGESRTGIFEFYYSVDDSGNYKYYSPEILSNEDNMSYEDLHAKIKGDGYDTIPMVTYLVAALRTPYFDYRIPLSADLNERNAQLAEYGLSADSSIGAAKPLSSGGANSSERTIFFAYIKSDKTTGSYAIEIGGSTITGSGYYFRVSENISKDSEDGTYKAVYREYIYVTRETNYFKYAVAGIEAYINPVLVASGLENDQHALYAPYITPEYKQWKTELHKLGSLPNEESEMKNVLQVFADTKIYMPYSLLYDYDADDENRADINLYEEISASGSYIVDMTDITGYDTDMSKMSNYVLLLNALSGKSIGDSVTQCLISERNVASNTKYRYKIKNIESVITLEGDVTSIGAVVSELLSDTSKYSKYQYVRVTYELYEYNDETGEYERVENVVNINSDGTTERYTADGHGVINLYDLQKLGFTEELDALKRSRIGDTVDITLDVEYAKSTSGLNSKGVEYYLDSVLEIREYVYDSDGELVYDENGNLQTQKTSVLSDTSIVVFRYYYKTSSDTDTQFGIIEMTSDPNEQEHDKKNKIRAAIKAWTESESGEAVLVFNDTVYTDVMSEPIIYEIDEITGFVSGELTVAFSFVNASERDPFYGESMYEKIGDFMLYAMNEDVCEKIVKLFGGLTETSSAEGLVGDKTVKLGIDANSLAQIVYQYNTENEGTDKQFFGHTVHFSLPRELYDISNPNDDELDDFGWMRTLDFVLHVSEPVWEIESGSYVRYVASEMYDIIAKIDADTLGYLELDTVDLWARRTLLLVDLEYLAEINIKFMMDDLKGEYCFELEHSTQNSSDWIGRIFASNIDPDSNFTTRYDEYLKISSFADLTSFYEYLGYTDGIDGDPYGTAMFKEIISALYFTSYEGTLTEDEQKAAKSNGALFELRVKMNGINENANTDKEYCFTFYRVDDSRFMVRIHEEENGRVVGNRYASDFYISSFAFQKIVTNFIGILNGEELDANEPYPDFKPLEKIS